MENVKTVFFADDVIIYVENPNKSMKKLLEVTS